MCVADDFFRRRLGASLPHSPPSPSPWGRAPKPAVVDSGHLKDRGFVKDQISRMVNEDGIFAMCAVIDKTGHVVTRKRKVLSKYPETMHRREGRDTPANGEIDVWSVRMATLGDEKAWESGVKPAGPACDPSSCARASKRRGMPAPFGRTSPAWAPCLGGGAPSHLGRDASRTEPTPNAPAARASGTVMLEYPSKKARRSTPCFFKARF